MTQPSGSYEHGGNNGKDPIELRLDDAIRRISDIEQHYRGASEGRRFPQWLFLLFLGLKLTGGIGWSWWWVASPLLLRLWFEVLCYMALMYLSMPECDKDDPVGTDDARQCESTDADDDPAMLAQEFRDFIQRRTGRDIDVHIVNGDADGILEETRRRKQEGEPRETGKGDGEK